MWGGMIFFVLLIRMCRVKTMRSENVGGRREPRAGKNLLTHKAVKWCSIEFGFTPNLLYQHSSLSQNLRRAQPHGLAIALWHPTSPTQQFRRASACQHVCIIYFYDPLVRCRRLVAPLQSTVQWVYAYSFGYSLCLFAPSWPLQNSQCQHQYLVPRISAASAVCPLFGITHAGINILCRAFSQPLQFARFWGLPMPAEVSCAAHLILAFANLLAYFCIAIPCHQPTSSELDIAVAVLHNAPFTNHHCCQECIYLLAGRVLLQRGGYNHSCLAPHQEWQVCILNYFWGVKL